MFHLNEFHTCELLLSMISKHLSLHWKGHTIMVQNCKVSFGEHDKEEERFHYKSASFNLACGMNITIRPITISKNLDSSQVLQVLQALCDTLCGVTFLKENKEKMMTHQPSAVPPETPLSLRRTDYYYLYQSQEDCPTQPETQSCLKRLNVIFGKEPVSFSGDVSLVWREKKCQVMFWTDSWGTVHATESQSLPPLAFLYQPALGGIAVRLRRSEEGRLPLLTEALQLIVTAAQEETAANNNSK